MTEETRSRLARPVRALLAFVCALVLVDTLFFTALTPLLPHYTHVAHLSKSGQAFWSRDTRWARWSVHCPGDCSRPAWATGARCCSGWCS